MPGYDWEPESQQILRELLGKSTAERSQVSADVDGARQTPAGEVHVRIKFDDVFITYLLFSTVLHIFHR